MKEQKFLFMDQNFSQKLDLLQKKLRSRMNGETSSQMSLRNANYAINYGLSLQNIKEIATQFSFTNDELQKLWQTNIREAMIISAINYQDPQPAEMLDFASQITTPDMVEQASFFLFWRTNNIELFLQKLFQNQTDFSSAIAYFSIGNLLKKSENYNENLCSETLEFAAKSTNFTICEMRGLSLFVRQLIRKKFSTEKINNFVNKIQQLQTIEARTLIEEVKNEMEIFS